MAVEINPNPEHTSREMRAFILTVDKTRLTPGFTVELITCAEDPIGGFKKIYSHLDPHQSGEKLDRTLTAFINKLVPKNQSRETLEKRFEDNPDKAIHKSHSDILTSEWQTIHENVVIGVREVKNQRGESVKSWYLKNISKKPGLFSFLKK